MKPKRPATVLVVDDDPDILATVEQVLAEEGYGVACAPHGQAALDWLRSRCTESVCLILLDLMMPVMDGWQFRDSQLRDPGLRAIPVLVVSAHGKASDLAGVAGFVAKPVSLDHLLDLVERHSRPVTVP